MLVCVESECSIGRKTKKKFKNREGPYRNKKVPFLVVVKSLSLIPLANLKGVGRPYFVFRHQGRYIHKLWWTPAGNSHILIKIKYSYNIYPILIL